MKRNICLITVAGLLIGLASAHAADDCPLPAEQLDQHTALQALQLHDQLAVDLAQIPRLKQLLSEDFSIRQLSDGDSPKTLMVMDRASYLENARLAVAFSSDIKAEREQLSSETTADGLQLGFIETDTGTVMKLPIRIVSRNRAGFSLQDGCITINSWEFVELSSVEPDLADGDGSGMQ